MTRLRSAAAISCLFVTLALGACGQPGMPGGEDQFSQSYVEAHLVKGRTTMQDVQALYGQPFRRSTQGGNRVYWTYRPEQTGSMGMLTGISQIVPGVGLSNSLYNFRQQQEKVQRATDASSGNTDVRGSSLDLTFQNGVLVDWSL